MKLEGRISMLVNREETTIKIKDDKANVTLAVVSLTPEQLSMILSRQVDVECEIEVGNLSKIGKTHECKSFEFEIPSEIRGRKSDSELQEIAQSQLSDGWVADGYFGSQNSFFAKDGKQYARCTIRHWV